MGKFSLRTFTYSINIFCFSSVVFKVVTRFQTSMAAMLQLGNLVFILWPDSHFGSTFN